ncbi:hypothetical protein J5N97_029853 [Dioscorea zingiberensis]|uniref:Hydrophobic seed protein domain-containing protein n=1 Tax=Dioscorea zingiberensis TaxID=325984 RepID=A0A9D5H3I0_9LILI|nr:hypothetical protein J5N97_029853 [Dioscorea zingiberensis]
MLMKLVRDLGLSLLTIVCRSPSSERTIVMASGRTLAAVMVLFNLLFFASAGYTSPYGTCPYDSLKLKVCVDVLNGLVKVDLGQPQWQPCCDLFPGLLDVEVATCLCTAIKSSTLLGTIPVGLSLLVNQKCGRTLPGDFHCA